MMIKIGQLFIVIISTCTLETQIRAFYFKHFHRAICTNQFLHKIGRIDSPLCPFFVKNLLNPIFICFVTVKKFFLCGII